MKDKMIKEMKTIEITCWFVTVIALLPTIGLIVSLIQADVIAADIAFAVYGICAAGVSCLVALMTGTVKKEGKAFTKKLTKYLDCLQGWVYLISLAPALISFAQRSQQSLAEVLGFRFLAIWFIGVAIGIFTRIYRYGCDLQDDMDTIA